MRCRCGKDGTDEVFIGAVIIFWFCATITTERGVSATTIIEFAIIGITVAVNS